MINCEDTSIGNILTAAADIISPDNQVRRKGLDILADLDAASTYPLVGYLLSTRLTDPDLSIRAQIVHILADVLATESLNRLENVQIYQTVRSYIAQFRSRQIYGLLQVAEFDPNSVSYIEILLASCPYAGNHLVTILADRKVPISIRKLAAIFIGKVGYLDALPGLERIESRLASKLSSQELAALSPLDDSDETALLPQIQNALSLLRAL
jgi:hypothetical protein